MMKRKYIAILLLLLSFVLVLSACGADNNDPQKETQTPSVTQTDSNIADTVDTEAAKTPDIAAIAAYLADNCAFSEELTQNDPYLKNHAFGFSVFEDKLTACTAYVPSGIISEEIFLFALADEADADSLKQKLEAYVSYQISQYSDYAAQEVPKLEDAVIVQRGKIVVYVVCSDNSAAADIIDDAFDACT